VHPQHTAIKSRTNIVIFVLFNIYFYNIFTNYSIIAADFITYVSWFKSGVNGFERERRFFSTGPTNKSDF